MVKAVIDLGTNTFNLLIAEVSGTAFKSLYTEKEGVSLGMGGINRRYITAEAQHRAFATLTRFKAVCARYGVQHTVALGTSALRDATNSQQFVEEVAEKLGIYITIISGKDEANLIYKGVCWSYSFNTPAVIMDIGGGSTEFIFAQQEGITDLVSLNIGVSRIFQHFSTQDPLSQHDISTIEDWLEEQANGYFEGKSETLLIGASGSFETFYEVMYNASFPAQTGALEIPLNDLNTCISTIIASTQAARDANPWIIPIRKKMAPLAALKTRWIIQKLGIQCVLISPCSLKEGALNS